MHYFHSLPKVSSMIIKGCFKYIYICTYRNKLGEIAVKLRKAESKWMSSNCLRQPRKAKFQAAQGVRRNNRK